MQDASTGGILSESCEAIPESCGDDPCFTNTEACEADLLAFCPAEIVGVACTSQGSDVSYYCSQ